MRSDLAVSNSKYAFILPLRRDSVACYIPVITANIGDSKASFIFAPEDAEDESFLSSLSSNEQCAFAFGPFTAILAFRSSQLEINKQERRHSISFEVEETDFTPVMEPALGSLSSDELAKMRAERLLFNAHPSPETSDLNAITQDIFVRGSDTTLAITASPFPGLYESFG